MCLILFALRAHPHYPLIVAANRDESYERPTAAAAFWDDSPDVYGGRDLEHGGTWLAAARDGRFAAITNYRQGQRTGDAPCSRGALTRDYLTGSQPVAEYLKRVRRTQSDYHGFSLIAGTPDELYFCSNRGEGVAPITPGAHGLSNRLLDEPWPKVVRGIATLNGLLDSGEHDLTTALFEMLADRSPAPEHLLPSTGIAPERERDLSAAFIASEHYGTRASTVVLMGHDRRVLFLERSYGPHGNALGATEERFSLVSEPTASRTIAARA